MSTYITYVISKPTHLVALFQVLLHQKKKKKRGRANIEADYELAKFPESLFKDENPGLGKKLNKLTHLLLLNGESDRLVNFQAQLDMRVCAFVAV